MAVTDLVDAVAARTDAIVDALGALDGDALAAPSRLPGWSRLTIACHLRFGADAFLRMTRAAVAGEPVAYYPEGREQQRPATLVPAEGEPPAAVVESLGAVSASLHDAWRGLDAAQWETTVVEPEGRSDLGPLPLVRLPVLRLTEVEVHGADLDVGLDDWSDTFVSVTLPFRLDWLNTRRTNHRPVDNRVEGSWLLDATDGPTYRVTLDDGNVQSHPVAESAADCVIRATSRDLLALLLGRPLRQEPTFEGDVELARSFSRAFPGP